MSQDKFNSAIAQAVADGWLVSSQTDTTASLTRRHRFSWGYFVLWLILFVGLGGLIYWIYWLTKKPESLFIELSTDGDVRSTRG